MKTLYGIIFISLVGISLYFIYPFPQPSNSGAESRWYDQSTVDKGSTLFKQNCSSCHGVNAEATLDWKKADSNGKYPPPPLNGTAHAWHHSIEALKQTIQEGGVNIGGSMPSFESKLSDEDQDAVIAYFQSKWPDDIYQKWSGRFQTSDIPLIESTAKLSTDTQDAENNMTSLLRLRLGNLEYPYITYPIRGVGSKDLVIGPSNKSGVPKTN